MAYVEKTLRQRPLKSFKDENDALQFVNFELQPAFLELRREVNRTGGDVVTVTENDSVRFRDRTIFCDATDGAFTVLLPPAAAVKDQPFTLTKTDATASLVLVSAQDGETIVGAQGYTGLTTQYNSVTVFSNGTEWFITGEYS